MLISFHTAEKIIYAALLSLLLLIDNSFQLQSQIIVIYASILNFRLIIQYRRVIPVLIFFVFSFSYVVPFIYFFFFKFSVTAHTAFNNSHYLGLVIYIYSLFLLSIFLFSKVPKDYIYIRKRLKFHYTAWKYYLILVIIIFLVIYGLRGQNLMSGSYNIIEKTQSPLFEYSLIFLSIAALFIENSKFRRNLLLGIIIIIIAKDLSYGGRVTSIQILLLTYILLFEDMISKKWVFIFLLFGFIIMHVFVAIRSNPLLFLSGNFTINDIFLFGDGNKELASNQGDAAQSSARFIGLIDVGVLSFSERIASLLYSILSIFTPGISFSELANLAAYKSDLYRSGGGGLLPVYFFVWLSYPGVVLSGFIISKAINIFITSTNNYLILFSGLVMCTFPRWLAYNPIIIFKLCIYVIPVYYIFKHLNLNYFSKKPSFPIKP